MEGTSITEHTEAKAPVDPEKRQHDHHFKPELCFITHKQYTLFRGNFAPHISHSLKFSVYAPSIV